MPQIPLLDVRSLVKTFEGRPTGFGPGVPVRAVDDVSFTIEAGETLALVGESGSGKTTVARMILGLIPPSSGEINIRGQRLQGLSRASARALRRDVQAIFQDPESSLNPRLRVRDIVAEPLAVHRIGSRQQRRERAASLLGVTGLDPTVASRFPRELSAGQRQRVATARALALTPALLVADEPVASLDRPVQLQIVALLRDLRARFGLACLFITHDLRLARGLAHRIAVMQRGRLVELAAPDELFERPQHPYTQALVEAGRVKVNFRISGFQDSRI